MFWMHIAVMDSILALFTPGGFSSSSDFNSPSSSVIGDIMNRLLCRAAPLDMTPVKPGKRFYYHRTLDATETTVVWWQVYSAASYPREYDYGGLDCYDSRHQGAKVSLEMARASERRIRLGVMNALHAYGRRMYVK